MGSIWEKSWQMPRRGRLEKNICADAAVIGGGMAGVLTARALGRAGLRAVVLEAGRLGGGATGHTTAKVTAQHGLFCAALLRAAGPADARLYARANLAAVEDFRRMVRQENIDCDWEDCAAAVYGGRRAVLEVEAAAARRLGLPVTLTASTPELPFETAGAVWLEGQARFHPLKFLAAAAEPLEVYEHTPVRRVEGDTLLTPGGRVRATAVVFACHYPFVDFPGLYFARMYQQRSYVVALEGAPLPDAVYIGAGPEGLSLRRWQNYLLLGGGGHRTGEADKGGYPPLLAQAVKGLARRFLPAGAGPDSLAPGSGGVIRLEGETVGAWREADGRLCVVDLRCPHMGCRLEWNPHERSWDCPCHGSRFDRFGHLISGPAQEEICHDGTEE